MLSVLAFPVVFVLGISLAGGIGAAVRTLKPTAEDKDAGLVGIRQNFDLSNYRVIAVDSFILTAEVNDENDKTLARLDGERWSSW